MFKVCVCYFQLFGFYCHKNVGTKLLVQYIVVITIAPTNGGFLKYTVDKRTAINRYGRYPPTTPPKRLILWRV